MSGTPLSLARFQAALERVFTVTAEGTPQALALRLVEVKPRPGPPGFEQFSAFFVGPPAPLWPQGVYRFAAEGFGDAELLVVPLGPVSTGIEYEVCVSTRAAPDPA